MLLRTSDKYAVQAHVLQYRSVDIFLYSWSQLYDNHKIWQTTVLFKCCDCHF